MTLDAYVGIPFRDAHCWELVRRVYMGVLGIHLPEHGTVDIEDGPDIERRIDADMAQPTWRRIDLGQERAFDLLIMTGFYVSDGVTRRGKIHCGLVARPGRVLHVEPDGNSHIADYSTGWLRQRVKEIHRHRALAELGE